MKKIVLVLSIVLLLVSCSSDSNNSSSSSTSGVYKWSFKLDGVLYQWSSQTDQFNGGAQYSSGDVLLTKNTVATLNISLKSVSTGNFTCNNSSGSSLSIGIVEGVGEYGTSYGGTMNVNISSLSSNTLNSNPLNPGKVIGTFTGTIKAFGGSSHTVTEGSFEAMRVK